jgi:integrase/recombinase XerD
MEMRHTLDRLVSTFLADLTARAYSPRTLEGYRGTLRHLIGFLAEQKVHELPDVSVRVLTAYQNRLVTEGGIAGRRVTTGTQAFRIGHLHMFFRFLIRRGYILANPAEELAVPRSEPPPPGGIPDLKAMRQLLLAPDIQTVEGLRDRAILELLYSTGVRASELVNLDVRDIDLASGELHVHKGKGGRSRQLPVGEAAVVWVGKYLKRSRPHIIQKKAQTALFLSRFGLRLSRRRLSGLVAAQGRRAKLAERVTPHLLRHAFATHMLRGGANLRHVQELLGHRRATTTQVYTRLDINDLKEVHRRCHPRGRD